MRTISGGGKGHREWIGTLRRSSGSIYRKHLFFDKITKTEEYPECWTWVGMLDHGKPTVKAENGRNKRATMMSAKIHGLTGRAYAPGCGNPRCVRPDHLVLEAHKGRGTRGIDIVYGTHAHIAGDLSLRVSYIVDTLGGSRFTLWRWRKDNPKQLFNGRHDGKH